MASKTYYITRASVHVRRLDNLTLPWTSVDVPVTEHNLAKVQAFPGEPDRAIVTSRSEIDIFVTSNAGVAWAVPGGDWATHYGSPGNAMDALWIVDTANAYCGGTKTNVFRSTDGGLTFNKTLTNPTMSGSAETGTVAGLHFISPLIGVALVTSDLSLDSPVSVWKTIDGGDTWTKINSGSDITGTAIPLGIWMSQDQSKIAVGLNIGVYASTDSGATFTQTLDTSIEANPSAPSGIYFSFFDDQNIWIGGLGDVLRKSIDGGQTWNVIRAYNTLGMSITSFHFYSPFEGFLGYSDAKIYSTNDSGSTTVLSESFSPQIGIWTEEYPQICYELTPCDPQYPALSNVIGDGNPDNDPGIYVGNVIKINGSDICYFVSLQVTECGDPLIVTSVDSMTTSSDCVDFELSVCPIDLPLTIVGETATFEMDIALLNPPGAKEADFAISLGLGAPAGLSLSDSNITLGSAPYSPTGTITITYTPTQAESGSVDIIVVGPCFTKTCTINFSSVAVPSCPHFNIDITGPACAPDCISPGSVVQFDLGGNISPIAYPTVVHFSVYNSATNEEIFHADYPVANDTELDAIVVNFIAPGPGHYCSEVCLPGCNTLRTLCFDVCEPFDIYKDECNKWHVHRPHQSARTEFLVDLYELEGDYLITDQLWDTEQDNTFEFEFTEDGIYIFEMKDPDTKEVIYSFSAFETCALQECYMIMMDKIMCSCSDPCCKKCTGVPEQHRDFARMTLNKLVPLYLTYLGLARRNELYTTGMKWISDEHRCFLHDANQVLGKILEIIEDCGCLCPEQKNTASNRGGCTSC